MKKCEKCRYWNKTTEPDSDSRYGECRRRPPVLCEGHKTSGAPLEPDYEDDAQNWGLWPFVYSDDWCGEFEPKESQSDAEATKEPR